MNLRDHEFTSTVGHDVVIVAFVSTGSSSNWRNSTSTGLAKSRDLKGSKFLAADGYLIPISTFAKAKIPISTQDGNVV